MIFCVARGACAVTVTANHCCFFAGCTEHTLLCWPPFDRRHSALPLSMISNCCFCRAFMHLLCFLNPGDDSETQALRGLSKRQHLPRTQTWGNWVSIQAICVEFALERWRSSRHLHALVPAPEASCCDARYWRTFVLEEHLRRFPARVLMSRQLRLSRAEAVGNHVFCLPARIEKAEAKAREQTLRLYSIYKMYMYIIWYIINKVITKKIAHHSTYIIRKYTVSSSTVTTYYRLL